MYYYIAYTYDLGFNHLHVYGLYDTEEEAAEIAREKQKDIDEFFLGEMKAGIARVPRKERT